MATGSHNQSGVILVVVLGLSAIFLAMLLAITVRVFNNSMRHVVMQQHVQAWLMMMAGRKVVAGSSGPPVEDVTGGVEVNLFNSCGRVLANSLGWFRIRAQSTMVIAAGGGSARNGTKDSLDQGDALMNSYEVRLLYSIDQTAPHEPKLQPVGDYKSNW